MPDVQDVPNAVRLVRLPTHATPRHAPGYALVWYGARGVSMEHGYHMDNWHRLIIGRCRTADL